MSIDDVGDDGWSTVQVLALGGACLILGAAATALYYRYTQPPQTVETMLNPTVASAFGATEEERNAMITSLGKRAVIETTALIAKVRGTHGAVCFSQSLVSIAKNRGSRRASVVLATTLGCPQVITTTDLTEKSLMDSTEATAVSEAERGDSAWDWLPPVSMGGVELYQILKAAS